MAGIAFDGLAHVGISPCGFHRRSSFPRFSRLCAPFIRKWSTPNSSPRCFLSTPLRPGNHLDCGTRGHHFHRHPGFPRWPSCCRGFLDWGESGSSCPEVGTVASRRAKALGTVLKKPPVLLVTVVGFLLIGSAAAVEVAVVSRLSATTTRRRFVLAIWALGSLIGGLALGHVQIGPWALAPAWQRCLLGLALAGLIARFLVDCHRPADCRCGIAPALAVMFAIVSSSVKFSDTAEAYGWMGSGQLIGAAAGSALPGSPSTGWGATGGFVTAIAFGASGFW
jgi:hypothetical protein